MFFFGLKRKEIIFACNESYTFHGEIFHELAEVFMLATSFCILPYTSNLFYVFFLPFNQSLHAPALFMYNILQLRSFSASHVDKKKKFGKSVWEPSEIIKSKHLGMKNVRNVGEKYNWFPRDFPPLVKPSSGALEHQLYYTPGYDEESFHV